MTIEAVVVSGVMPGGERKVTIRNCPGANDMKSLCVYLRWVKHTERERIYYTSIYFHEPHLVGKNKKYGLMKIETEKQPFVLSGMSADLFALRALCVGMQEMGENSCIYCNSPKTCPVRGLLGKLSG